MINEGFRRLGSWNFRLKEETPISISDHFKLDDNAFGHFMVTPTPIDLATGDPIDYSIYTGVYRGRTSRLGIRGIGPAMWLADDDDKSDYWEISVSDTHDFDTWVNNNLPGGLTAGDIQTTISGTLTGNPYLRSRLDLLDYVCLYFDADWVVTPQLELDAGTKTHLFGASPVALFCEQHGGRDLRTKAVRGTVSTGEDVEDYTTDVIASNGSASSKSSVGSVAWQDFNGNDVILERYMEATDISTGALGGFATGQLNRFIAIEKSITIFSTEYDPVSDLALGADVNVFFPDTDLYDLTVDEIMFRGEPIWPVSTRLLGRSWPILGDYGKYFYTQAGEYIDLTPWIEPEQGSVFFEVGSLRKRLSRAVLNKADRILR